MTSRERVYRAMRRQKPDRVPFDFSFGFSPYQLAEFKKRTGCQDPLNYFGADTRMLRIGATSRPADFSRYFRDLPAGASIDEWGVGHQPTTYADERFSHLEGFLYPMLELESRQDALDYPLPDIEAAYRYALLPDEVTRIHQQGLCAVAMEECTIFEVAWYMRSMERLLLDFLENSEFASVLLDRITEKRILQAQRFAGLGMDVLSLGDDVGTQRGLLLAADLWRRWLKPRLAEVIASARRVNPEMLIFYHSDGDVTALIPDLIEIGVEILNPVQPECMDVLELKKRFGSSLSFWGTIGTQSTFPFGTPEEVRRQVQERVQTVGAGGGLFLAPTHFIESEVPWENIVAFAAAVKEVGTYS